MNSPRKCIPGIPHILEPPAHELRQLLLVDPDDLLLGDVVVLVLLEPPVLRGVLREGAGALSVRRLRVLVAVRVLDDVRLHLEVRGLVEDLRDPLLGHLVLRAAEARDAGVFA